MLQPRYPVTISTQEWSRQMLVTSSDGKAILCAVPKLFSPTKRIDLFADVDQHQLLFTGEGKPLTHWHDFTTGRGQRLGAVQYQFWESIFGKTAYKIFDPSEAWIGQILRQGLFSWTCDITLGQTLAMHLVRKQLFNAAYTIEKLADLPEEQETLLLVSIVVMVALERIRGARGAR